MAAVHPRPAPARPGPRATVAARPASVAAAVVAVALLVALGAAASPAAARAGQDPGVTTSFGTESTTTAPDFTTAPPSTAATTVTTEAEAPATGTGSTRVADENRKIWAVVGGLVFVAFALSLLTIRYWRKTRPVAPDVPSMLPTEAALATALTASPAPAAEADHEVDDGAGPATEPVPVLDAPVPAAEPAPEPDDAAAEAAPVEAAETEPAAPVGPEAWAPTVVGAAAADHLLADTGDDTAPVPVVDAPAAEPAAARRAVAGADHAAADEAWEPRGTGEHERVVVAPAARPNRLTPEQRAALFATRPPRDA